MKARTSSAMTISGQTKLAIRATIALMITFLVTRIFHFQLGMWILISANFVLQIHAGETVRRGFERLLGHALGFFVVVPIGLIFWQRQLMPFIWTPMLIFISQYYSLRNYFIYSIFLIVIIIYLYISFFPHGIAGYSLVTFSFIRAVEITFGALIAILVSLVVFPRATSRPLLESILNTYLDMSDFTCSIKMLPDDPSTEESKIMASKNKLHNALKNSSKLLTSLRAEPVYMRERMKLKTYILNKQYQSISNLMSLSRIMLTYKEKKDADIEKNISLFLMKIQNNFERLAIAIDQQLPQEIKLITNDEISQFRELAYQRYDNNELTFEQQIHYNAALNTISDINDGIQICAKELNDAYVINNKEDDIKSHDHTKLTN